MFFTRRPLPSQTANGESLAPIREILSRLEKTPGRIDKEKIIRDNLDVPYFRKVLLYTFDPFKVFHLTECYAMKNIVAKSAPRTLDALFQKLDELCAASGASKEDKMELSWIASANTETLYVVNRILSKNLKCGVGPKTIHKFIPEIPQHDIMLCDHDIARLQKYANNDPTRVIWQDKLDGVRVWAQCTNERIAYTSRNGKTFENFGKFDAALQILAARVRNKMPEITGRIIFDGEVAAKDRKFDVFMGNVMRHEEVDTSSFHFYIFDIIVEGKEETWKLIDRLNLLAPIMETPASPDVSLLPFSLLTSWDDISVLLTDAITRGEEGGVCKWLDGLYEYKRSGHWCKIKNILFKSGADALEADVNVIGKLEGTSKYSGILGALLVDFNGVTVKVGSGFTEPQRYQFWESPPTKITVKYQNVTEKGSLRFPIFVRDRTNF